MKTMVSRLMTGMALLLVLAMVAPTVRADGLDDYQLKNAIPADAFLAVYARDHEGLGFLNQQVDRLWAEVEKVRFDRDLKKIFKIVQKQNLPPGAELEGFDEWWQHTYDMLTSVEWGTLGKQEFAMGMKIGFPTAEFVVLLMPPADKVESNFQGLTGILAELAKLDENALQYAKEQDGATEIHRVSVVAAPFPMGFCVARHQNVLLIGFGPTMTEQTLALLQNQGGDGLASTQRFKDAFKKLPAPKDQAVFFDAAKMFQQVRTMVAGAMEMAAPTAPAEGEEGYDEFTAWTSLPNKILDQCDIVDYTAEVRSTEGKVSNYEAVAVFRPDAKGKALYKVFFGNKPLSDPLKYIPVDAQDFSSSSGIDVPALYTEIVNFIKKEIPDGESMVAELDTMKEETGWDIEKEVVGWIGGQIVSYSIPGPTPYSPAEFVFMLGVRDEAQAKATLDRLMTMLNEMLASQQGSVVPAEIEGVEGFKSVAFPMLAMMGMTKPTLGVHDGWLFFGSSPEIITKTLDVAAGKIENVSKNERFQKEGIMPKGQVVSVTFKDLTKVGEQLSQVLQMLPMMAMMAPDVGREPIIQAMLGVVSKVGRVVRKLDFLQSSATCSRVEGNVIITKGVTTYREPPEVKKPTPPDQKPADG